MQIINEKGCKYLYTLFNSKPRLNKENQFVFTTKDFALLKSKFKYITQGNQTIVPFWGYEKYLQPDCFDEVRGWKSKNSKYRTNEMDHQHLSNTIGYFELCMVLNKLTPEAASNYLQDIKNNILPEIDARFNSVVLPYVPYFDFEKQMVEQSKKIK